MVAAKVFEAFFVFAYWMQWFFALPDQASLWHRERERERERDTDRERERETQRQCATLELATVLKARNKSNTHTHCQKGTPTARKQTGRQQDTKG